MVSRCIGPPISVKRRRLLPSDRLVWYFQNSLSGNNSVVECDLAKVEVAGSNPVSRSKFFPFSRAVAAAPFLSAPARHGSRGTLGAP